MIYYVEKNDMKWYGGKFFIVGYYYNCYKLSDFGNVLRKKIFLIIFVLKYSR